VFIEPLQDAEVMEGTRLYLTCSFAGRPMPQIQWLRDTTPIHSSAIYRVGIIEITETGVSLGWAAVSPADGHLTNPAVAGLPGLCENFRPTASKS